MGEAAFEVAEGIAWFRLTGEQVLESAVRQIVDAIARTKAAGVDKLLVDITGIEGIEPPAMSTRLWLISEWARAGRGHVRTVLVARHEFIDPDRIGVIAGMNSGFVSNVFETEPQALDWLLGRHGGDPSKPAS